MIFVVYAGSIVDYALFQSYDKNQHFEILEDAFAKTTFWISGSFTSFQPRVIVGGSPATIREFPAHTQINGYPPWN